MMYTIQTSYKVRGGLCYGTAKITGPRGVRTITVQGPIPKGFKASISGTEADISLSTDQDEVGWFGSDIVKAASNLGKATIVKKLGEAVKSVVKSDITKVAVASLAVAFPPVGVPAAAAFATASTVMKAAEMADKYAGAAKSILKGQIPAGLDLPITPAQMRAGLQAKNVIAETIKRHQAGDQQATKFLKTLVVAKQANQKLAMLKNVVSKGRQTPGLLVLPSGDILRGAFNTASAIRL